MYNVIHGRAAHPTENRVFLPTYQLQPPTMPPIRTESSQNSANQEGRILLALSDIKDDRIKSLRAAAKLYDIPYRTLAARASRRAARVDKRPNGHKLT
jgi:hypothetical protein